MSKAYPCASVQLKDGFHTVCGTGLCSVHPSTYSNTKRIVVSLYNVLLSTLSAGPMATDGSVSQSNLCGLAHTPIISHLLTM